VTLSSPSSLYFRCSVTASLSHAHAFLDQLSGTDIIDALRIAQPQSIPAILISAAEEITLDPIRKRYPDLPILQKPFKIQVLISLIKEFSSQKVAKLPLN
jgi:FixJ family two-component response regulator